MKKYSFVRPQPVREALENIKELIDMAREAGILTKEEQSTQLEEKKD